MINSPFRLPNLDPRIAAQMPDPRSINMVAPQAPAPLKQKGLLARLGGGLLDRLMPAPAGGLLTEQDIKNARRQGLFDLGAGLLAAGGPSANQQGTLANLGAALQQSQGGYQDSVNQVMGRQMAQQEMQAKQQENAANQAAMQQEQAMQAARQKLFAENPPPADPAGYVEWAKQMWPKVAQMGDLKTAEHLKTIIATQGGGQGQQAGTYVTTPGPDGRPMKRWVSQAEAAQGVPEYERPQRDTNEELTINSQILRGQGEEKWFQEQTKGVQTTIDAYMGAIPAAKMKGAGDLQVLYSFIRALDPGSVVREGEIALANQSAPLRARAEILAQKIASGEGGSLSDVQREQMIQLMKQMVDLKVARTRAAYKSSQSRIQQYGLPSMLYNPLEAYDAFVRQQQGPEQQPGPYKSGYVFPTQRPSLDDLYKGQ